MPSAVTEMETLKARVLVLEALLVALVRATQRTGQDQSPNVGQIVREVRAALPNEAEVRQIIQTDSKSRSAPATTPPSIPDPVLATPEWRNAAARRPPTHHSRVFPYAGA